MNNPATPEKIIKEIKAEIDSNTIKTSLFLINKINTINKKYRQAKNPKIQNILRQITREIKLVPLPQLKEQIKNRIKTFEESPDENTVKNIVHKIKNGSIIFIYGSPKTAIASSKEAHKRGVRFSVIIPDSGRQGQGIRTAEEISKANIKVEHIPDFLIDEAIKKADFALFEAHALIKNNKIIADIGADKLAECAKKHHTPIYAILDIFSIDMTGALKEADFEVMENTEKQNLVQINKTKTTINSSQITGAVTQKGILSPKKLGKIQSGLF